MKDILDYIRNLSIGKIIEFIVETIIIFFVGNLAAKLYLPNNDYYNPTSIFIACIMIIVIALSIVFIVKRFIK
ncbi:MAG: hypothetical protein E7311_00160 [Clostridiales bacterium]|nr:hypothetical protein [Clostridiales bacterium]